MKQIQQIAKDAVLALEKKGIATCIVICKDPDGEYIGINKQGNKIYLLGALNIAEKIIASEIFAMNQRPPEGDEWRDKP